MTSKLTDALKGIIKGEVLDDQKTLDTHSIDTSLFQVMPQAVVAPKDTEDVKALVNFTREMKEKGEDVSLTARAAGTDMTGGPLNESIIVDFVPHFNRMLSVSGDSVTAEPGVFYRDLDKATREKGMIMPSYPASRELCTIGGMIANNAGGEKTLQYGKVADYVTELAVVLSDGNEYRIRPLTREELEEKKKLESFEGDFYRRMHALVTENADVLKNAKPQVSKSSSGYALWDIENEDGSVFDLTRLFTGSQGTLGLITEATLRLVEPKEHSRLLVLFLKETGVLGKLVKELRAQNPETLESYDDHTFTVAIRLFPQIVKRLGGNLIMLAIRFIPEFLAVLTGGVPKLVLLAEFTAATDEEALQKAQAAQKAVAHFGIRSRVTKSAADAEKYWTFRRESFNLLRQKMKKLRTAPFIEDITVRPDSMPEFLPELYGILDQYPLIYTIAGHMGDGNFHIIPLMDMHDPRSKDMILEITDKVHALVRKYKGSNTGEHNDGIVRTVYLKEMFGDEVYALFQRTKEIFDPYDIFNPRKKVGDDVAWRDAHFDLR